MAADELDFSARYRVDGRPGVAFRIVRHPLVRPECWGHDDGDNGQPSSLGIGETWYCDGTCQQWEPDESRVVAVMVGDDREHVIDVDDLTELDDDAYCSECGQIGCTHGIGTYTKADFDNARAEARAMIDNREED